MIFSTITVSQTTLIQSIYTSWTTLGCSFYWWVAIWSSVWPLVDPLAVVAFLLPRSPHWLSPGSLMLIGHLLTICWCSGACRITLPFPFPPVPPWNALFSPIQPPEYFISHFLLCRNVHKVTWYIFDQGEMYWGLWMRCRNHHGPLSFIHLMYT
jgi:hypothetical protein